MKHFLLPFLTSSAAHSAVCLSFVSLIPATILAAPDAAQVAGDLQVDGIHFSSDGSVQTKANPWGYGAPNGLDIGFMQGNVGIGTLTPAAKLDVAGTINATNITSTGNVGIGTASPSVRLDVAGDANISGTLTANALNATNATITGTLVATYMQGINLFGDEKISGSINMVNPNVCRYDYFGPSIQPNAIGSLSFSVPNVINGNCNGYSYQPKFPVMTVANIGNSPGVGIGTASPIRPLHIFGGTPEISLQYSNGTVDYRTWNLSVEGGALPNLDIRVLNDAGSVATRQVLSLRNNGDAIFSGNVAASGTISSSSSLDFGSNTRQMINLWGSVYGLGVQSATQYNRIDAPGGGGGFAWYRGGVHSDSTFDPGAGGTTLMRLDRSGNLTTTGEVTGNNTNGGIAVYGINVSTDAPAVEGWNQGSGDLLRGWAGASGSQILKFRALNNGTVWALNGYTQGSDIRLKSDIQSLEGALDKVLRLRGISYVMKSDETKSRKIGVIAQELEQEYPELVVTDDQGMKSVAYANLTPVLIEAVKALKAENDALKSGYETLRIDNEGMKARLEHIEQLLQAK